MSEYISDQLDEAVNKLFAAFELDEWINMHRFPIKIRVEDGRLVLEGRVENVATKRRAVALAEQIVKQRWSIEDRLRREPVEVMGDRELRDEIMKRLSTEPVFSGYTLRARTAKKIETIHDGGPGAYEILVHVDGAAVSLTGSVGSLSHRRFAEALVWWASGCETVDNQLEVTPPEEDNDNEITDAVRMVLEKDPLVQAEQVHIGTAGGVVNLEGLVTSEAAKKFAALDAWSVPGVRNVSDRIKVKS